MNFKAIGVICTALLVAFVTPGCDSEPGPENPPELPTGETAPDAVPENPATAAEKTFAVRGYIARIPTNQTDAAPEVFITHEEVPELPMAAMTMPFILENGQDVADLGVGDKVGFTMVIGGRSKAVARGIEKLPPETQLDLPERLQPKPE
ncbi:MAG: copper-binding protein [Phycisphaerae bacterium]